MLKLTDELVIKYDSLIMSIVNKFAQNYNREDLYQVGRNALLKASLKYDENANVKFSTFSYKYILGEILKYIREDKNLHVSRDMIRLNRNIKVAEERYYMNYGKYPSSYELSLLLKENENKIKEVLNLCQNTDSLDEKNDYGDNELSLYDVTYDKDKVDSIDLISLKYALSELSKEDRNLIYQRYFEDKTQTEIAEKMNISQVKVYRMEKKILDELNSKMCA